MRSREDDCEIERDVDRVLDCITVLDEEVGAHSVLITRRYQMVEANEAAFERFARVVIEPGEYEFENVWEEWLDGSAM